MKIAMVSEVWEPVYGGGTTIVEKLCHGLVKHHDCEVDLFVRRLTSNDNVKFDKDESLLGGKWNIIRTGITSHFFNIFARLFWIISFTFYFLFKAKKEKYDLIHAHALLPAIPTKIVSWILRIPLIYSVHGTMHLDSGNKNLFYWIESMLIHIKYNYILSDSHNIQNYLPTTKEIEVVHNGVDIETYDHVVAAEKYEGLHFLTVARMDWQKNHIAVLKVLAGIEKSLLDDVGFRWNLVGDGVLKKELEDFVIEKKLTPYVTFKGKLFGADLIREYKSNHVFILPSLGEGQPLTLLEAFASRLPVIATEVGDNALFIKNDHNGHLVRVEDLATSLESALRSMFVKNKEELVKMGENGYQYALKYDWSVHVTKTYEVYRKVI